MKALAKSAAVTRRSEEQQRNVAVLLSLFRGLLNNTFSGDAVELAIMNAAGLLAGQMPKEEVRARAITIIQTARRTPSPIDELFDLGLLKG